MFKELLELSRKVWERWNEIEKTSKLLAKMK